MGWKMSWKKIPPACHGAFVLLLCGVLAGLPARASDGDRLNLPWGSPKPGPTLVSDTGFTCPAPYAKAPQNLYLQSVYDRSDPSRAKIDEERKRRYREETRDLRRFENTLLSMTNDYLRSGQTEFTYAECALEWLHSWAEKDALLGKANFLGRVVRHWTLASLASAYAQVRDYDGYASAKKETVERWLAKVAYTVIDDYPEDSERISTKNNLSYWAAWAVTITGVAINDREFYDWGIERAARALGEQLHGDGTFPYELKRGRKALHYHIFAAIPLVMIAETGTRNGDNLYEIRGGILHRLVKRILYAMEDTGYMNQKAGAEQEPVTGLHPSHFTWMEPYQARFPRSDVAAHLKEIRPIFLRRTGGDMTWLYSGE